jgi:TonB-linked SusC/RagA family outer membrane protein
MQALEEVVIIGYGSVKKRDLTGSVSRLSSNVINNQAVLNDPIQALQGKIAGADITVGNAPGTTSTIIIRGYNSLYASNNPLIVVDDAPFGGSISDINPNEIETMDILKDASSTAIYGARGANGVVIITTKRAQKDGKLRINYDGYYGLSRSLRNYDLFNGEQYADFKRAANQGKTDPEIFDAIQLEVLGTKNFTDWQELMFSDNGYKTDHSVSISQSTGKNRNMIVLGYNKDQSIISNMSYERFSARINGDLDLSPNLSVGYSSLLAVSTRNNGDNNTWGYGTLIDPLTQVYDKNGDLLFYNSGWYQTLLHSNPIFDTKKENVDSKDKRSRTLLNMFANWEIINGLKFRTSLTYDLSSIEAGRYYSSTTQARQLAAPSATFNKDTEQQLTFTNLLNYKKSMGKHNVDISLVHDMQTYKYERVGLTGQNMAYFGSWYNVSEAPDIFSRASAIREWALLSFMGRVNYTFNDRYLLTLTGRYDGSSRLAKGNQWDFFPSFALAWRLKEEEFLNEADFLSNLKLRLSWGNSGNTAIDEYATLGALGKYIYYFGENEQSAVGYLPTELANTQLGWEKTEEYDIGIDFGFMDNRINGSIDLYQRNTHDVLMQRNLPYSSGYGSTWHNIGKTRNTGIELSSNIIPIATRDFKWNVDVSFAYNKNEIVELFNGKKDSPGNNWFIGKPFYIERLYKFIGIWQTDEAEEANKYARVPGDPKIMDVNNNYIYDDDDRFIYNRIPKWTAGLSTGLYYKNWDFNIYLYSRQNYYQALPMLSHQASSTRMNHRVVDYWTPDHPTNESPLPRITESNPTLVQSDYIVRDLSFVKLKNVNLGYTFPQSFVQKIKASKLRVYFMVDNPYVWTKSDYPGLDPENCNDYFSHRPLTSYILGVNLGF